MENISKMEMANALFNQIYIKTEKCFFGFKTKVTYAPTNSPVVGTYLEFAPAEGQKVKAILEASPTELDAILQKNGRPQTGENGNMKLNLCYSRDHEFAAFHLQQFSGFEYRTIIETRFVVGNEAIKLLQAFIK
ncbi:hypothetical protein [Fibrobacter sp.]|uniref:hypothetical protein n=1 Tax=Fibrobacter sp. TaxID=35828 RepID=UPI003867BF03